MKDEHAVTFALAYGLDAQAVAKSIGAYYEPNKNFLHATGFILRPERMVHVASYSTGPIGRLTAADVIGSLTFAQKK